MVPVIWSIAGTDSGGGAGLAADQRAADAFGVHLCPVVATVTAQNTTAVTHIDPVPPERLDAQLAALAEDLPPAVIKTGLLGSAANVEVVARWVDRLRQRGPLPLVIDPVLRALFRAAGAELIEIPTPPRVAITEYVDVAHAFFEEREAKFVNGVLDAVAKSAR